MSKSLQGSMFSTHQNAIMGVTEQDRANSLMNTSSIWNIINLKVELVPFSFYFFIFVFYNQLFFLINPAYLNLALINFRSVLVNTNFYFYFRGTVNQLRVLILYKRCNYDNVKWSVERSSYVWYIPTIWYVEVLSLYVNKIYEVQIINFHMYTQTFIYRNKRLILRLCI